MITRMISFKKKIVSHARDRVYSGTTLLKGSMEASAFCDMTTDGRLLFIAPSSNSNENVQVYDGIQIRDTFAKTSANEILRAALVCIHRGVLFAARIKQINENGVYEVVENEIRWSAFAEMENFDPWGDYTDEANPKPSYQNFEYIGNEGEPIVRLISFRNSLYVFKRNSIWRITGTTSPDASMVGPEAIVEVHPTIGLIAPNSIAETERSLVFLSDMGLMEMVGDQVKHVGEDIHEYLEHWDRGFWEQAVVSYDKLQERLYVAIGKHRKANDILLVNNAMAGWYNWTLPVPASCIENLTDDHGEVFTAIGDINDGIGILSDDARKDYGYYDIPSKYGTDWSDLGWAGVKDIRSMELIMRVEGDFAVTVNIYHDMSRVPYETLTFKTRVPDPVDPITGEALTDVDSTADRETFFPYTLDLSGQCRKIRYEIVCEGENNRFKVSRVQIGFIRGTKI